MSDSQKDLMDGVLRYVRRLLQEGRFAHLSEMGLDAAQVRQLERLTLRDFDRLATLGGHFMQVSIDREAFDRTIARLGEEHLQEELQDEFLRRGAPAVMMRELFGLGDAAVTARKRLLGITHGPGRPRLPAETQIYRIVLRWRELARLAGFEDERARYLRLAEETCESLATLWAVVQREADFEALLASLPYERRTSTTRRPTQPSTAGATQ